MTEMSNQTFRAAFAQRLAYLMKRVGMSTEPGHMQQTATHFSVAVNTLKKWLNGDTIPEPHRWRMICGLLNCSLDDLFFGGDGWLHTPVGFGELAIIDGIANGKMHTRRVLVEIGDHPLPLQKHVLYQVTDNVMEPFVMSGDMVVVDTSITSPDACSMMLISVCNHLIVRRIQVRLSGEIVLIPENPKYQTETLPNQCGKHAKPPTERELARAPLMIGAVVGRLLFNR